MKEESKYSLPLVYSKPAVIIILIQMHVIRNKSGSFTKTQYSLSAKGPKAQLTSRASEDNPMQS